MPATAAIDNETLDHLLSVGALNGWPDRPVMLKRIVKVTPTNVALRLRGGIVSGRAPAGPICHR